MVAFERALARAEGAAGAIPADAATRIDSVAASATFDAGRLVSDARRAGTLAIAFTRNTEENYYQLEYACHEGERDLQHIGAASE